MKKPIVFVAVGVCSLLALVGCSSEKDQSENVPMSSSGPMSSDAPMSEPMSERAVEPTKEPTPEETTVEEPNAAPEPVAEDAWVSINGQPIDTTETVSYGEYATWDNGLSLTIHQPNADFDPSLDTDEGVNKDTLRLWGSAISVKNSSSEPIDLALNPISCRGIQNGNSVYQKEFVISNDSYNLAPGEEASFPFRCSGTLKMTDGPLTTAAGFAGSATPYAVLYTD